MDIRMIGTLDELELADKLINEQFKVDNKSRIYECKKPNDSNRKRIYYNVTIKDKEDSV